MRALRRRTAGQVSRRPRAGVPSGSLTIRVTNDERDRWLAAAIRDRVQDVGPWLRDLANARAQRAEKTAPPGAWSAALAIAKKARK